MPVAASRKVRVAVIGSGLAGLATGHLLAKSGNQTDYDGQRVGFEVHVFEKAPGAGMDSGSISVPCQCEDCIQDSSDPSREPREMNHVDERMDVPLRAMFPDFYPLVIALYDSLGIVHEASDHSMSVWQSQRHPINPATDLFQTKLHKPEDISTFSSFLTFSTYKLPYPVDSHLFFPDLPSLWGLIWSPVVFLARLWKLCLICRDYWKMWLVAREVRKSGALEAARKSSAVEGIAAMTLGEFFQQGKYSDEFVSQAFLPMFCVLCTCTFEETLNFPAVLVLDHFATMGLVGKMSFATRGIKNVCEILSRPIHHISGNTTVTRVCRESDGKFTIMTKDASSPETHESHHSVAFDHVIFATTANNGRRILEESRTDFQQKDKQWLERAISVLGRFVYAKTVVVCHTDKSLMPATPQSSWKCLNFVLPPTIPNHMARNNKKIDGCEAVGTNPLDLSEQIGFNASDSAQCTHFIQRTKTLLPKTIPALFSTTNPIVAIDPALILGTAWYERAIVTMDSMRAVGDLRKTQGGCDGHVWFVGSYGGEGVPLLEGCMETAVDVVAWLCRKEGVVPAFDKRMAELRRKREQFE
ncbi:hypothetical protein HDU98_001968 [Podochytrium sp. JEL0797]|nr:hypothetical protein HDU98_001968 [Podochytrium sp. JEL0797]